MTRSRIIVATIIITGAILIMPAVQAAPNHLVINELQISGGAGHTTDDFIELYNPTASPIDLQGMRLVKRAAASTSDTTIKSWTGSTIIPSHGYYLWANSNYSTIPTQPNATTSQSLANNNSVALRRGPADTGTVLDSVAWGSAQNGLVEGQAFPANPPAKQSLARKIGNDSVPQDTNNNADDFYIVAAPTPQATKTLAPTTPLTNPKNLPAEISAEPRPLSIGELSQAAAGEIVSTAGQVTKLTKTTFTLQSNDSEVRVNLRDQTQAWPTLTVGTKVTVVGVAAVSRGSVELRPRTPTDISLLEAEPTNETVTISRPQESSQPGYLILIVVVLVLAGAYLWQRYAASHKRQV